LGLCYSIPCRTASNVRLILHFNMVIRPFVVIIVAVCVGGGRRLRVFNLEDHFLALSFAANTGQGTSMSVISYVRSASLDTSGTSSWYDHEALAAFGFRAICQRIKT
jgi:hypothetical protein